MVVTGPCIASCEIDASFANRFGTIVDRRKWVHQMRSAVHEYGHAERLTGFYDVGLSVEDFQKDLAETNRRLLAAGRKAVEGGSEAAVWLQNIIVRENESIDLLHDVIVYWRLIARIGQPRRGEDALFNNLTGCVAVGHALSSSIAGMIEADA